MTAPVEVERGGNAGRLVLVADANSGRGRRLADECRSAGFECKQAGHGAAALELALSIRPAVVVAHLDLPLVDALKLSEILRANPRTRSARFLFLGPDESLAGRGSVGDRLLPSDTRPDELVRAIEDLFEKQERIDSVDAGSAQGGRVQGDLAKLPLADLLQSFLLHRRSGRLELVCTGEESGESGGLLLLRDGDVIQAEVGMVDGEKALFRMLSWRQGSFVFRGGRCDDPPSILVPTRRLLVEGLRQLEEWDRLSPRLPPLDAPVRLKIKHSELPNIVHPLTQDVLLLLDLYGVVREVVDHSAFPDYQVLRTLHTLAERGIVQLGRVPVQGPVTSSEGLFNEAQARRLRDWIQEGDSRRTGLPDAKLLVVASNPEAVPEFVKLLSQVPGAELPRPRTGARGGEAIRELEVLGRLAVDEEVGIELVHLPGHEDYAAFWPLAGHGALGTIFLLRGAMSEEARRIQPIAQVLARLPRARTFHVVLLAKQDRIAPDELRENLALIDEASLFLLPLEGRREPLALLRTLFTRVLP